jgi:hypothetical protein
MNFSNPNFLSKKKKMEEDKNFFTIRSMNKDEIFEEIDNSTYDNLHSIDYYKLNELQFNPKQWCTYFKKYTSKEWVKKE